MMVVVVAIRQYISVITVVVLTAVDSSGDFGGD
jgi:hypothetical protein